MLRAIEGIEQGALGGGHLHRLPEDADLGEAEEVVRRLVDEDVALAADRLRATTALAREVDVGEDLLGEAVVARVALGGGVRPREARVESG